MPIGRALQCCIARFSPRGNGMTAAKADRIIRLLAVVVGGFGLWVLVAMGVPLVFSLIHAVRQPPGDKLAITIFTFVTFAALMGCFVVIDGYCVIAAWRVWRQPPSRPNVRLLSALTATMLWLIASSSVTAVLHPSDGDAEIGNAVTLLSGMLAVAAMCFHGWLSRWLIARARVPASDRFGVLSAIRGCQQLRDASRACRLSAP
jgi:hypothetical protein